MTDLYTSHSIADIRRDALKATRTYQGVAQEAITFLGSYGSKGTNKAYLPEKFDVVD